MIDKADLHIHTTASGDALNEPKAVFRKAKRLGLKAISFTDHNSIFNHDLGVALSRKYGIEFIRGIEISSSWKGRDAHILAYFNGQVDSTFLLFFDRKARAAARNTAADIITRMQKLGLKVTLKEYDQVAKKCTSGDSPLLKLVIKKGYVRDIVGYKKEFGGLKPEDRRSNYPDVRYVIKRIHEAGGIAVIAHPAGSKKNRLVRFGRTDIKNLAAAGIDGIEVFHELNEPPQRKILLSLAAKYNLLVTGGSDSHGISGERAIGSHCCDWERLKKRILRRHGEESERRKEDA